MTFREFRRTFSADLKRYTVLMDKKTSYRMLRLFVYTPGLWTIFLFRLGSYLDCKCRGFKPLVPFLLVYNLFYFLVSLLTGISLPLESNIGPGLYIGHWGGITVHPGAVIGRNFNISQGVTIGEGGRGLERGVPVIGDRVYIGPGAKVFGRITVGSDVAVGANAVVNKTVPDNAVVGGIPATVLNYNGSKDFVIFEE